MVQYVSYPPFPQGVPPARQNAAPGPVSIGVTALLVAFHVVVGVVAAYAVAFSGMWFDGCSVVPGGESVDCSGFRWMAAAVHLAVYGGAALVVLDVVGVLVRLVKRRNPVWVPIACLGAHLAMTVLAFGLAAATGPVDPAGWHD